MPKKKIVKQENVLLGSLRKNLKSGIVGISNVGKSTLFQAITKTKLGNPGNYLNATIETVWAEVIVPDERFNWLCQHYNPKSRVPAKLRVYDIAGLNDSKESGSGMAAMDASKESGFGNDIISHIHAVDGLFHVVRSFDNIDVVHPNGGVNPIRDLNTTRDELQMKDIKCVQKRLEALSKETRRGGQSLQMKKLKEEQDTMEILLGHLERGANIRKVEWTRNQILALNQRPLLTAKPVVYLVNMCEEDYVKMSKKGRIDKAKKERMLEIINWVNEHSTGDKVIPISIPFEKRLSELETSEDIAKECENVGAESALSKAVLTMRKELCLGSFFTTGPDEVRQWTIRNGTKAPQAGGIIHTDLEETFIQVLVYNFDVLKEEGDEATVRAKGKLMTKGKDYVVEDGDILDIKYGASKRR